MINNLTVSLFLFFFLIFLRLTKHLCLSRLTTLCLLYIYISILSRTTNINCVDTGSTTNIGNKVYFQWLIFQCPSMITKYLERGTNNKYDAVQLLAILDLK